MMLIFLILLFSHPFIDIIHWYILWLFDLSHSVLMHSWRPQYSIIINFILKNLIINSLWWPFYRNLLKFILVIHISYSVCTCQQVNKCDYLFPSINFLVVLQFSSNAMKASGGDVDNFAAGLLEGFFILLVEPARQTPTSDPSDESSELSSDPEEAESDSEAAFLDFFDFLANFAAFLALAFFMSLFSSLFSRA